MADGGYPPGVSVQIITREQKLVAAGLDPASISPGGASPPNSAAEPVSAAAAAVSTTAAVDNPSPNPLPASGSIQVTGQAALTMARMMGLEEVWNAETGEPISLAQANERPELAYIDFAALQTAMNAIDREEGEKATATAAAALPPFAPPQPDLESVEQARVQQVYASGPAGPGVTVRFIGPIIRVEVAGPVKLEKRRAGDLRILQIETQKTVEHPASPAHADRQVVTAPANRAPDPIPAIHRIISAIPAPVQPPPQSPQAEPLDVVAELVQTVGKPDEF